MLNAMEIEQNWLFELAPHYYVDTTNEKIE